MNTQKLFLIIVLGIIVLLLSSHLHASTQIPVATEPNQSGCVLHQTGTLTVYNQIDTYNFSSSPFRTYLVNVSWGDFSYVGLSVYDSDSNFIDSNSTTGPDSTLVFSGEYGVILKVLASEFTETPQDYSLCVTELIVGGPRDSLATAEEASLGSYTDTFEQYNDLHWFNFSASASKTYEVTVTRDDDAEISLLVYDGDMALLDKNTTLGPTNLLMLNGESKYVIVVAASEFIEFPQTYMLTIEEQVTSSSSSTGSSTTSSTAEEISSTDDNGFAFSDLSNLDYPFFALLSLLCIPIMFRRKFSPRH